MKHKLVMTLLSAILASTTSGLVSAKQTQVIELATNDPASKIATIRVNAQSLMIEVSDSADSTLFTDEAVFTINHKDKTYRVQSYADLQANTSRKAAELAQSPENTSRAQGVEFKLTDETDTISGFKARKLVKTKKGEPEAVFWVSSELVPPSLRGIGESLRSALPADYWQKVGGNPGMPEIVVLFGVPLRITYDHHIYHARVSQSSEAKLQVPAGYRKLDK
jgi:hypothetical protein